MSDSRLPRRIDADTIRIRVAHTGTGPDGADYIADGSEDIGPSHPDYGYYSNMLHRRAEEEAATATKAGEADPKASGGATVPPADNRWPAWAVDTALTMATAEALRHALAAALPAKTVAALLAWAGDRKPSRAEVRDWLTSHVDMAGLGAAIRDALAQGYAVGSRAARAVADWMGLGGGGGNVPPTGGAGGNLRDEPPGFNITVDWGKWTPGNLDAARAILDQDGNVEPFLALLRAADVEIKSIAAGRLDEVAMVVADGLERGEGVSTIGRALRGVLDNPQWAEMTAWTETNRAQSAAALQTYRARGVPAAEWFTAMDQRVCPTCGENEAAGPVPLGQSFPSGDVHPPAHPRCRCALLPVRALPSGDEL